MLRLIYRSDQKQLPQAAHLPRRQYSVMLRGNAAVGSSYYTMRALRCATYVGAHAVLEEIYTRIVRSSSTACTNVLVSCS